MYMYQKYPWKTEFNFLLAFENQNKLVRCSIFNGYSSFIPGNQMTQWFFEMLWVWQNFQLLMTVKYLPSGWPSFVEVGDRPSWLSWWAKAALCCCKSSSWLCFSSLISFYDTNIHTNLLRSRLKRGNKFSTRDEYLKQRSLRIFILIWIHFLPCQQVYTILLNSYWMINIHESAEYFHHLQNIHEALVTSLSSSIWRYCLEMVLIWSSADSAFSSSSWLNLLRRSFCNEINLKVIYRHRVKSPN